MADPRAWVPLARLTVLEIVLGIDNIVHCLDSVFTDAGPAEHLPVMILAIVIAVGVMMISAGPIGDVVVAYPTFKILALSFLFLIGVALVAEGPEFHIPKGYIYFAMACSTLIELLNLMLRKRQTYPRAS